MTEFEGFQHRRASTDAGSLHYLIAGDGPAVLLLHGWPQHSLQWHAVAPALAEHYRVIVPDLPGCGGSAIPRAGYDKRSIASAVLTLIDELDPGPLRVVGYDHGAGVAYNLARQRPEQVRQLVFVEYVLPGCGYENALRPSREWTVGSNWQLSLFTVPDVAEFAFRGRERELLTWFFWHASCDPTAVTPEHLREYTDQIAKPGALRAGIEYYAAAWQDMDDNVAAMDTKLTMPALGVGGRHNLGPGVATAMSGVATDVASAVIDDAGHWISDENPRGLTETLQRFFSS